MPIHVAGPTVTRPLYMMNVIQTTLFYLAGSACMAWLLSPFCRDVEIWIKSVVSEQIQMKKISGKRRRTRERSTGYWKNAMKSIQGMHSIVNVWRSVDPKMSKSSEKWQKSENAAVSPCHFTTGLEYNAAASTKQPQKGTLQHHICMMNETAPQSIDSLSKLYAMSHLW